MFNVSISIFLSSTTSVCLMTTKLLQIKCSYLKIIDCKFGSNNSQFSNNK